MQRQAGGTEVWIYVCMCTLYSGSMSSSISLPVRVRTLECRFFLACNAEGRRGEGGGGSYLIFMACFSAWAVEGMLIGGELVRKLGAVEILGMRRLKASICVLVECAARGVLDRNETSSMLCSSFDGRLVGREFWR